METFWDTIKFKIFLDTQLMIMLLGIKHYTKMTLIFFKYFINQVNNTKVKKKRSLRTYTFIHQNIKDNTLAKRFHLVA